MLRAPRRYLRVLWAWLAALALVLVAVAVVLSPRPAPSSGTVLLLASGRSASSFSLASVQFDSGSSRRAIPIHFSGRVAAAPDSTILGQVALPAGIYDAISVGDLLMTTDIRVQAQQLLPILIAVEAGRPQAGGLYIGNAATNLGLQELAGRLQAMPAFSLLDQKGTPFTNASLIGHEVVIAAFHTNCTVTCPLYTGLFLQLQRQLPPSVLLVEATTDPWHDTPQVLDAYASRVGANWTFLTGTPEHMEAFWGPFTVQLSGAQLHSSTVAIVDAHGYIRTVYQGVPDLGGDLPGVLEAGLSYQGYQELHSHGDGWGAPQLLDALRTIQLLGQHSVPGGQPAPDFAANDLQGNVLSLSSFRGRPLLINFWATWCVPCRAELPLLEKTKADHPGLEVLLVNERDDRASALKLLAQLHVDLPSVTDPDGKVGVQYGVVGLPVTVFVYPDGVVEGKKLGQLDQATLTAHLAALERDGA